LFYDTLLFRRRHAVPAVVASPLFGRGAVHGLDDHAHTHRKAVFLACLDSPGVAALVDAVDASWEHRESRWQPGQHVRVFDEAVEILGDAVLTWARVEPRPGPGAAPDLATMVEGFGSARVSEGVRRRLPQGHRLVLDVWGTNHVEKRWADPDEFRPERFVDETFAAFDFVPQGGGDPVDGHRCPGEPATVRILARCSQRLADLDYEVA